MKETYYEQVYHENEMLFKHTPYYLEQKLINNITSGNLNNALKDLREINKSDKAVLADDPLRSAKNSIICSCTFFYRAAINAGISPEVAFADSDAFINELERLSTTKDVLDFEETILRSCVNRVEEFLKVKYPPIVVFSMQYIDSNLTKKISLIDIAEYVHVHPNYLSTVFKRKTGISLVEYINQRRLSEASYFVAHTGYDISDIASLYGFCNQGYFITKFQKYYGQTPQQFRKSLNKVK
jgi:YesN/AraC family two-component response regulator